MGWNYKELLSYLKSTPSNLSIAKFGLKTRILKFGTKIALFGLGIENTIVTIKISVLKFAEMHDFVQQKKCLNLGPKIPYLGIFGMEFEKGFVIFEITLQFF